VKPPRVRYVAVVAPVREVILAGTADLAYWRERLRGEGLHPHGGAGKAGLLISAVASTFRGLPFREFSISVAVSERPNGATHDGFYLAHAYNSSRLLAFAERAFFQTPYYPADIRLAAGAPVTVDVRVGGAPVYAAAMATGLGAVRSEDQDWEGRIYLPRRGGERRLFYARLAGPTGVYPFTTADTLAIRPGPDDAALRELAVSGFGGQEWRVRTAATHSRSKTNRWSEAQAA